MTHRVLIVVPARYGSSRFPGKPLAEIAGRAMVARVAARARKAAELIGDAGYVVATDDQRIADFCTREGFHSVMTDAAAPSGSDRALAAAEAQDAAPAVVVNLQGDAPFTPVETIALTVKALSAGAADAATPCVRLDWAALDAFRDAKAASPSSGTTCVTDAAGRAIWFSKAILPAIRNEEALRAADALSPVRRHIGLYAYRLDALRAFTKLPPSPYEQIEGLEQLRLLENGMSIDVVDAPPADFPLGGVDTPEDLARLEALIADRGDPDTDFFR